MSAGRIVRGVLRGFGELLITAGVVLLLFVAWELWWTNVDVDGYSDVQVAAYSRGHAPGRDPLTVICPAPETVVVCLRQRKRHLGASRPFWVPLRAKFFGPQRWLSDARLRGPAFAPPARITEFLFRR